MPSANANNQEFRREVKDEYRACRALGGHGWLPTTFEFDRAQYKQGMRCMRCKTNKVMIIGLDGEIKRNVYEYPEDYLLDGGGALTAQERAKLRVMELKVHAKPVTKKAADKPRKRTRSRANLTVATS